MQPNQKIQIFLAIGAIAFWLVGFCCLFAAGIIGRRMIKYVKRTRRERWEYLTTNWECLGPGMRNSGRSWAYIFNEQGTDDEFIRSRKFKMRKALLFGVLSAGVGLVQAILVLFMKN